MPNNIMTAKLHMKEYEYSKAIGILNINSTNYEELYILATCYFKAGEFQKSYDILKSLCHKFGYTPSSGYVVPVDGVEWKYCFAIMRLFNDSQYDKIEFAPIKRGTKQSIELPNEMYPETDDIAELYDKAYKLRERIESNTFASERLKLNAELVSVMANIENLFNDINSNNVQRSERAYLAHGFLNPKGDLHEAFACYYTAIGLNPNKALYYGYAGHRLIQLGRQLLQENQSGLDATRHYVLAGKFIERAVDLDKDNPRWHFYRHMVLQYLSMQWTKDFIYSAENELRLALKLCRHEQKSLKAAIQSSFEINNKVRLNLGI